MKRYIVLLLIVIFMSVITACGTTRDFFEEENADKRSESSNKDEDKDEDKNEDKDEDKNEEKDEDKDDEQDNKKEENVDIEASEAVISNSDGTVRVGNETIGFINIPKDYANFEDVGASTDENLLQWSSYSGDWIVSLSVYNKINIDDLVDIGSNSMVNPEIITQTDSQIIIEDRNGNEYWVVEYKNLGDKTYYLSVETYNPDVEYLVPAIMDSYIQ